MSDVQVSVPAPDWWRIAGVTGPDAVHADTGRVTYRGVVFTCSPRDLILEWAYLVIESLQAIGCTHATQEAVRTALEHTAP